MGAIEPWHLVVVLVVALVVLGPRRLPEVGKSLGATIREFRKATGEGDSMSEAASPAAPAMPDPAAANLASGVAATLPDASAPAPGSHR